MAIIDSVRALRFALGAIRRVHLMRLPLRSKMVLPRTDFFILTTKSICRTMRHNETVFYSRSCPEIGTGLENPPALSRGWENTRAVSRGNRGWQVSCMD